MRSSMGRPPIRYRAIYVANISPPAQPTFMVQAPDLRASLHPGPLDFSFSAPIVEQKPPMAGMTMAERQIELPRGSYLMVEFESRALDPNVIRQNASMRVAEVISLVDLQYPGLVAAKIYEGAINTPGSFVWLPEGPMTPTAAPVRDPETVALEVKADFGAIASMTDDTRERYRLAARWFRRGRETPNRIDKLFSWWTVLEVFPAQGTTNVVARTSAFLHSSLYEHLTLEHVRSNLMLGRIYRVRGEVVHDGKAFVTPDEEEYFEDQLKRLEATCATCLRLLIGIDPGHDLDEYITPPLSATAIASAE